MSRWPLTTSTLGVTMNSSQVEGPGDAALVCAKCGHAATVSAVNSTRGHVAEMYYVATGTAVSVTPVTATDRIECPECRTGIMAAGAPVAAGLQAVAGNRYREWVGQVRKDFLRAVRRDPHLQSLDPEVLWDVVEQSLGGQRKMVAPTNRPYREFGEGQGRNTDR
jgi:DNA-directed RNA polymerase subunit RPC12/RpoP